MGVPAQSSGRLLERNSNIAPRGMIVQRQNPAYRSTHQILMANTRFAIFLLNMFLFCTDKFCNIFHILLAQAFFCHITSSHNFT